MSDSKELFGKTAEDLQAGAVLPGTGILPYQQIRALIRDHEIWSEVDILPGEGATVAQKVEQFALHEIDLTKSAVLEKDCVYVVPLLERLQLSSRIAAAPSTRCRWAIRARSMPRSCRAPSASSCARARASPRSASAAAAPAAVRPISAASRSSTAWWMT